VSEALTRAESLIRTIPDYPEPGVLFRDITPLLADASALRTVIHAMIAPFEGSFDVVAGVEARGFLLAGAAAMEAGVGLVPIRKAGKLPGRRHPSPTTSNTAPRPSRRTTTSPRAPACC